MMLYHGTASSHLPKILKSGLTPRTQTQVSNWDHSIPSNHETVYLTDSYALYFAGQAADDGDDLVVLEIAADMLDRFRFVADEDAVEQANRGKDGIEGTMIERTMYYREHAFMYDWEQSLKALGTCGYQGNIQPYAINRVACVSMKAYAKLVLAGYDPSITVTNYQIVGKRYREAMKWLFNPGYQPSFDPTNIADLIGGMPFPENRSGVEVMGFDEAVSRFCVV